VVEGIVTFGGECNRDDRGGVVRCRMSLMAVG
jgi:hypothetical protein